MPYQYDVFLSYRRYGEWPQWLETVFLPIFHHYLGEELGENPKIAWDTTLETGTTWPLDLASKLATSKILIALWSRQYFSSDWCRYELAHMLARERTCGLRSTSSPYGLIIPVIIHDGSDFPTSVASIQALQIQRFTNVRVARSSPTEEALTDALIRWMPDVAKTISRAPAHDPSWLTTVADDFMALLRTPQVAQITVPSF
jgi:hypothetical protein